MSDLGVSGKTLRNGYLCHLNLIKCVQGDPDSILGGIQLCGSSTVPWLELWWPVLGNILFVAFCEFQFFSYLSLLPSN